MSSVALGTLVASSALFGLFAGLAYAAPSCGSTIVEDTKLEADLVCATPRGLIIGAPDIKLDLNGHVVESTTNEESSVGIDNSGGFDRVTIRDGRVSGWGFGVKLVNASENEVERITFRDNDRAVDLDRSDGNEIERNDINFGQFGIFGKDSSANEVSRNIATASDPAAFTAGVRLEGGGNNEISRNETFGNILGIYTSGNDNVIERNNSRDNLVANIQLEGAGHEATRNVANNAVYGVFARGSGHVVSRNTAVGNKESGIELRQASDMVVSKNEVTNGEYGIALYGVQDSTVSKNKITDNLDEGLYIGEAETAPSRNVVASRNRISGSGADGIFISGSDVILLEKNRSDENGDDGIDGESAGISYLKNRANDNAQWGIKAAPGSRDLGGNKAKGNGQPQQCLNISCS